MAHIKMISVTIEHLKENKWRRLEEFDTVDTLKEHANSVQRHTKTIETEPGPFRFIITVDKSFPWANANALQLILSFDDCRRVDKHETVILQPGAHAPELATKLKLKKDSIMTLTKEKSAVYFFDSIGLPLDHSGSAWYKAGFNFEKMEKKPDLKAIPVDKLEKVGYTEIRIDITPCSISPDKDRAKVYTRGQPRPDLLRNVLLGVKLLFDTDCLVDNETHYKVKPLSSSHKHTFIFHYSQVSRYREIPPDMIDYEEVSYTAKYQRTRIASSTGSPKHNKSRDRVAVADSLAAKPSTPVKKSVAPLQIPEDSETEAGPLSAKSPRRLFGNAIDWNVVNGQARCPTMPPMSPKAVVTPKPIKAASVCTLFDQQSPPSTPDESLSEIRAELLFVESARRELCDERAAVRAQIRAQKVQNNNKILLIDRKMDEMVGALSNLKLDKEQLLKEQDELSLQEMRLDDGEDGIEEHLLSAARSVRLYKDKQLQRLEAMRSSKKRRISQVSPNAERSSDTITVKTPKPM